MTMMGSYDSPTFLGQKDKYLMGLSLPQLMVAIGVAAWWFFVSLTFPYSTVTRILIMVPLTGASLTLLFARISGLTVPMFVLLAIKGLFSKPSFEEVDVLVMNGDPDWVMLQRQKSVNPGFLARIKGRRSALNTMESQAKQSELRADVDKQVVETSKAAEQWVRDGVNTLIKGR